MGAGTLTMRMSFLFCLATILALSGCATTNVGAISKPGNHAGIGERRLLTPDGKKVEEVVNTAADYEHLGDLNLTRGDITTAFVNYTKALEKEPKRTSALYKTGRLFLFRGMTDDARQQFEKLLAQDPKNVLALDGMGRTHLFDDNVDKAVEYFSKALTIDERRWETHNLIGIAYDRQRKFPLAVDHYLAAIALKSDVAAVYNNLGVSYYMNGDYNKAKDAFFTAIVKGEKGGRVYNNLACTYAKLGEYRLAQEAFKQAGNEAQAQNNMGYIYMLEGKNKEAAKAFEKAIELNPAFYEKAHDNLKAVNDALQE